VVLTLNRQVAADPEAAVEKAWACSDV